jgi:hypothetical protein
MNKKIKKLIYKKDLAINKTIKEKIKEYYE